MKKIVNPTKLQLQAALIRPSLASENLSSLIQSVFTEVKTNGDSALEAYSKQFDQVELLTKDFKVTEAEMQAAELLLDSNLKQAIQTAAANIDRFHQAQQQRVVEIETSPGVFCWRKSVPIQTVGLYIPGGSAPLFSTVLMLGLPAKIANCPKRILCTPPSKDGTVNPAILYAAKVAGITEIYKVGGAQAIAAMTYGTATIPKVDKLFGPGNQYVTAAKQFAQGLGVPIDLPAGPSEVLVAADDSVSPAFIAADLLAQAEHGADSQVVLLTDSEKLVDQVQVALIEQMKRLPRAEIASNALQNSTAIVVEAESWSAIVNEYAPEHLIVMGKYENLLEEEVVNAGSVFLGKNTAESFGDYASGTNHTLPTAGFARAYSGVSLDAFVKKITYQRVEDKGLVNLGPTVITMAKAEQLDAHANAIQVRMDANNQLNKDTTMSINRFLRPDLRTISPYSSARDEFEGVGEVFLDANENGLLTGNNRYPDPLQKELKQVICEVKQGESEQLFLGNGSDEVLDLIVRLTCQPGIDTISFLNPSYGMYGVLAKINGLKTNAIALNEIFEITENELLESAKGSKVLLLCNPNNPTGKLLDKSFVKKIVQQFNGLVVVDEAYIDFCPESTLANEVGNYSNLIVTQTLSKAFGMAGLRVGMAWANTQWIAALNSVKPPYNISSLVQETAIKTLQTNDWKTIISTIKSERKRLETFLINLEQVEQVFPSEANFILFRMKNARTVYQSLIEDGIIVRNRSTQFNCENTLRVSIGSPAENDQFIEKMKTL